MQLLEQRDGDIIALRARGGMAAGNHVIDRPSILAVNAALATGRPLLVRGEPGLGKSQLARAVADSLKWAMVNHSVDGRTDVRDLLYQVDLVARLAEAQLLGATRLGTGDVDRRPLDLHRFVSPGPLFWAFDWARAAVCLKDGHLRADPPDVPSDCSAESGIVVLIDEIDKADSSVPNGLLDALGHGRFDVPGMGPVSTTAIRGRLVVITTNEERALPDAFVRRCWVHHMVLPKDPADLRAEVLRRGRAHFPTVDASVLERAVQLLAADREAARREDGPLPGVAEFVDLVEAVINQSSALSDQLALLEELRPFAYGKNSQEHDR